MNPFTDLQPRRPAWTRLLAQPALLVFALYFIIGIALVAWHAGLQSNSTHALARAEAQARAAALEAQLNQVPAAAEVLGALARQSRGGFPDFQKAATEVMARHPGLSSIELQPSGIVNDVVPREGNERALGLNVLRDPGQSAGANEAIAKRALTVSGPVRLARGEQGLVARVPLFQRASDGRESFWGFVAASMRLPEALTWTEVDRFPRRGYGYSLFVPASNRQKAFSIVYDSPVSLADSEQQPLHVQNLEFRLAVKPKTGWVNKTELAVESAVVLLFAGLASFLASGQGKRRVLEAQLAEAAEQLAQLQARQNALEAAHTQTREQMASAQAELEGAHVGLKQGAARVAELEAQLAASARERDEAAEAHAARQKEFQTALLRAQETVNQLQARIGAASQAEKATAAAAEERARQNETVLTDLRAKLETAKRSAREEVKAKAAELAQLQEENNDLKARLVKGEEAAARVAELEALLQKTQAEPEPQPTVASPEEEALAAEAPDETAYDQEPPSELPEADFEPEPAATPVDESPAESLENEPASEPEKPAPVTAEVAPEPEAAAQVTEAPKDETPAPAAFAEPPAEPAPAADPTPAPKPAAKPRRKKSRDDQMDLFAGETAPVQASGKSPHKAAEPVSEPKEEEKKPTPSPRLPPAPPVDAAELRQAVHLILPLLVDQDPGAKDCLRDNRTTFRSAFTPEAYLEFEQLVKRGDFSPALEDLKKAARKHGIPV